MKIKMSELLDAVQPMNKLIGAELPLKTAHKITLLVDKLNPHIGFFNKRKDTIPQGEEGQEKFRELLDYEVELDAEPVEISIEENVRLSASDINCLKPFVNFTEGKEK